MIDICPHLFTRWFLRQLGEIHHPNIRDLSRVTVRAWPTGIRLSVGSRSLKLFAGCAELERYEIRSTLELGDWFVSRGAVREKGV